MIVAIDGPAATGKSTSAKLVAKKLGFRYLDTGAMYRCVALVVLRNQIKLSDSSALLDLLSTLHIQFDEDTVLINDEDVSIKIRRPDVTDHVSAVSALTMVREAMVRIQRQIASDQNCVLEGRDIGTIVFPNADIKFFMVTDDQVRAKRRQLDFKAIGEDRSIEELIMEIRKRDKLDSERDYSPLRKAQDAIEVDTTHMSIDEQVDFMVDKIKSLTIGN